MFVVQYLAIFDKASIDICDEMYIITIQKGRYAVGQVVEALCYSSEG